MPKYDISKRKAIEKDVYAFFNLIDPSGKNAARYRSIFATMSDTEFLKFYDSMFNDDAMNYVLDIEDFKSDFSIETAEKALNYLNVPAEEFVMLPHKNMNKANPEVTKYRVIVGYNIEIRMPQTVRHKNSTSINISERSGITGQVVGDDKNGRTSDQENVALMVYGAKKIAAELNGFRADGLARKNEAYGDIARTGYCSVDKVEENHGLEDRTSLNAINTFFMGMGIKTDLVSPDYLLPKTIKDI